MTRKGVVSNTLLGVVPCLCKSRVSLYLEYRIQFPSPHSIEKAPKREAHTTKRQNPNTDIHTYIMRTMK